MKRNKKSFEGYRANKNERPLTIAHRGASALAEHENTLESFQIAIDIGADMVEFDVRKTSDDVLIVFHDSAIDGKKVRDLTYNRINDITRRLGYRVPKLVEVLDLCQGKIHLDIELKESGYERPVVNLVKERYGYNEFSIKSFKDKVSYKVKSIDPRITTGLLIGKDKAGLSVRLNEYFPARRLKRCKADFVSPHYLLCTREFVRRMKREGYRVFVWTVNNEKIMDRMIALRADGIISDRPDLLMKRIH